MHGLDEARRLVGAQAEPLPATTCELGLALGLRLAQAVTSDLDLPPFDASAMDGYAARSLELVAGKALPVAFEVAAGQTPDALPAGAVARIFTGAVLPAGADLVVVQEQAQLRDDGRVLLPPASAGENLRRAGELCRQGDAVAENGALLTPARLATLAAVGASRLAVIPRPRVAIVVTGDELVDVATRPGPGQIRDSNRVLLEALVREAGCALVSSGRVGDQLEEHRRALDEAMARSDLVLSSGGVSVGDRDLVPRVLAELGARTVLHKVRMKPGKPVLVARRGNTWVLGLPGNPVSVATAFRMFARPLIETLAGDGSAFQEHALLLPVGAGTGNRGERTLLLPARLTVVEGRLQVLPLAWKGSHDLVTAAAGDALLRLEPGQECRAGELAAVYALPWRVCL
ncbi:MAG: gephyrin-like molybdotransferase Glp [Pseudomonadota bacterium]